MIDLSVDLGKGLVLSNPLLTASGTFGYGDEISDLNVFDYLGGLVTKSITLMPRAGNPPPRITETPAGMLNSIGLANIGVDAFLESKVPFYRQLNKKVIVNIAGSKPEEYIAVLEKLTTQDWVAAFEINVSCPNVKEGGIEFGKDPVVLGNLVRQLRALTGKFLIIKLTPNVTDIVSLALSGQENGADALSLINTVYGAAIDIYTRRPKIHTVIGGLSGPAIKPIALAHLIKVHRAVSLPLIGIGGISNGADVIEFMLAGASAVELGTVNFYNPLAAREIVAFLIKYCEDQKIKCLREIVGQLQSA